MNKINNKKARLHKGFTLVELIVVMSIISLLASIVLVNFNGYFVKARDARRKSDLAEMQKAIMMYYADHGSYPLPYPGTWGGITTSPCGTNEQASGPNAYISGLTPNYIAALPVDPSTNASFNCQGYLYASDGNHYKLLSHEVYEESYPSAGQPFYDPERPTWSLMVCSDEPACSSW